MFFLTGKQRFLAARMFAFVNSMVSHRLMVTIEQRRDMQALLNDGRLIYGCIDTWLVHKLTGGRIIATEPSSASSTGLFDPYLVNSFNLTTSKLFTVSLSFQMDWGHFILNRIEFPTSILPQILDTAGKPIGVCEADIFGAPIPIGAIVR